MLDHRVNKINLSESLSLRDFKSREKAVVVVVVIVFVVVVVVVVVNFGSRGSVCDRCDPSRVWVWQRLPKAVPYTYHSIHYGLAKATP